MAKEQPVKVVANPRIFVKTCHTPGLMENPFTHEKITHNDTPILVVDAWTQDQIDAGKLELVE